MIFFPPCILFAGLMICFALFLVTLTLNNIMVSYPTEFESSRSAARMARWFRSLISFDHITAVSNVGSNPAWGTPEASQVLLAVVAGVFSGSTLIFIRTTDWPISHELKLSQKGCTTESI